MNHSIKMIIVLCVMGYSFDVAKGSEARPSWWSFNWRQYMPTWPSWIGMPEDVTVAQIKDFLGVSITGYVASSGVAALVKNLTKDRIDPVKAGFLIIAAGLAGGGGILYAYFRDVRIMRDLINKVNAFENDVKKTQNNYKKLQDLNNEGNVLLTSI